MYEDATIGTNVGMGSHESSLEASRRNLGSPPLQIQMELRFWMEGR
jgi:hypothetical protein